MRRSSVARAARRSVSLWRMWATLRIVVGPSAKQATAASVITVSLMSFMSTSMPCSGAAMDRDRVGVALDAAAHLLQARPRNARRLAELMRLDEPANGDRAAGDGRGAEEIARGRGVRFDDVAPQRLGPLRRWNVKAAGAILLNHEAELPHHGDGHGDVRTETSGPSTSMARPLRAKGPPSADR